MEADEAALIEAVKHVAKKEGIESFHKITPKVLQKGEGYLSQQIAVTVEEANNGKTLKLMVKQAYKSENIRLMAPIRQSFVNEIFFYSDLYPAFKQLSENCDDIAPKCYSYSAEDGCEYLILEDLREKNFETPEKSKFLTQDEVEFIMKCYGKFHAFSYATKEKNPEVLDKFQTVTKCLMGEFLTNPFMRDMMVKTFESIVDGFDETIDKEILEKIPYYKENLVDIFLKALADDEDEFMTFLHGDCWSNNIMVKSNDQGDLEDMRLIDFQLTKVGSPVCDLSYFFYAGAAINNFAKLDHLLRVYHQSLKEHMLKLDCNPKNIIPLEELQRQWSKYSKFGLMMALMVLKAKLQDQKDVKNLEDFEDVFRKHKENGTLETENFNEADWMTFDKDAFKRRCVDIIRHMDEVNAF